MTSHSIWMVLKLPIKRTRNCQNRESIFLPFFRSREERDGKSRCFSLTRSSWLSKVSGRGSALILTTNPIILVIQINSHRDTALLLSCPLYIHLLFFVHPFFFTSHSFISRHVFILRKGLDSRRSGSAHDGLRRSLFHGQEVSDHHHFCQTSCCRPLRHC